MSVRLVFALCFIDYFPSIRSIKASCQPTGFSLNFLILRPLLGALTVNWNEQKRNANTLGGMAGLGLFRMGDIRFIFSFLFSLALKGKDIKAQGQHSAAVGSCQKKQKRCKRRHR